MDMIHCAYDRLVDPKTLVGNPRNPNRHSAEQIRLLAKIINHTGWRTPITVSKRSGFIVRGHGRLAAALLLDRETVPVDDQDYADEREELMDMLIEAMLTPHNGMARNRWGRVLEGMDMNCLQCGKQFYMRHSELPRTFCSKKCAYAHRRVYPLQEYICQLCHETFTASEKPYSNAANHYCSLTCRNLAYREQKGAKNPNWQGGKKSEHQRIRQTTAYTEWRNAVFARDNYTCQECRVRGKAMHAHHIRSFANDSDGRLDNCNGVTLCLDCHGVKHGKIFRLHSYRGS